MPRRPTCRDPSASATFYHAEPNRKAIFLSRQLYAFHAQVAASSKRTFEKRRIARRLLRQSFAYC